MKVFRQTLNVPAIRNATAEPGGQIKSEIHQFYAGVYGPPGRRSWHNIQLQHSLSRYLHTLYIYTHCIYTLCIYTLCIYPLCIYTHTVSTDSVSAHSVSTHSVSTHTVSTHSVSTHSVSTLSVSTHYRAGLWCPGLTRETWWRWRRSSNPRAWSPLLAGRATRWGH